MGYELESRSVRVFTPERRVRVPSAEASSGLTAVRGIAAVQEYKRVGQYLSTTRGSTRCDLRVPTPEGRVVVPYSSSESSTAERILARRAVRIASIGVGVARSVRVARIVARAVRVVVVGATWGLKVSLRGQRRARRKRLTS